MRRVSMTTFVAGLALIALAGWLVAPVFGLCATGGALLVVGWLTADA